MVAKLLWFIPKHYTYVEVFGGGASLLFAKKPSPVEVYNDLDQNVVNLFRVLRDEELFKEFYRRVCLTPYARSEYEECFATYKEETDVVEKARKFFVVLRQSFAGRLKETRGHWGYVIKTSARGMASTTSRWITTIEMLPEIHKRLMRVQIENRDFRKILETYDDRETFFYLDPPYVMSTRKTRLYRHEMTDEDHQELVDMLLSLKGKWLLSGYINPIYERLERYGIKRVDFQTVCHMTVRSRASGLQGNGAAKKKVPRIESIWFNYDLHGLNSKENRLF